jgi:FixJ family two-component response regulator
MGVPKSHPMLHALYLIEPDAVERHRLQSVLAAEAKIVADFESAEAFLAQAGTPSSGCLVASAALPRLLALFKALKRRGVALPVICWIGTRRLETQWRSCGRGLSISLRSALIIGICWQRCGR